MKNSSRFILALHILTALACRARVVSGCAHLGSEELADSINTNPVVVRRLLGMLQSAGLVTTKMGRGGGSMLTQQAASISLRRVYEAVEGDDLFRLHYTEPNAACPVGAHIQHAVGGVFAEAEEAVKEVLARYTVADLMQDILSRSGIQQCLDAGATFAEIHAEICKHKGIMTSEK